MAPLAAGFSVIDNWYAAGTAVCQSWYGYCQWWVRVEMRDRRMKGGERGE